VIGSRLGHYQILAKLGEGGMGVVYLAEDDRLRRKVALKMLPPTLADDPNRLARFEREIKVVAALNHPNIVTIHSVEEEGGRRFFTMEHIEGRTLAQMIPLDGMPLKEFLKIAVPLADALTAAHARGIQHRDLKPSNVMVTTDGRVKVLDFGLARLKEHDHTEALAFKPETTLTQAGLAIGTLAYMSPEQLRMQATDHRSDIFSLGVVLFEMASGRAPFLGQSTAEVISSILRDQPAHVYETQENVPEELDQILRRCLEKEPAKRWSSAAELRDALAETATAVSLATSATRRTQQPPPKAVAPGGRATRIALAAAAALAVAWIGFLALTRIREGAAGRPTLTVAGVTSIAPRAALPSVAVLPLTSFSGEPEYYVDGITDALISSLARIRGLRVISRQSAMHFKGSQKLLPEIAKELGVEFVVEGSVARSGESVRLNAQVIRADPETTLWSETFERKAEEVLALESSFATAVAEAINVRLSPDERTLMAHSNPIDPAAYEALLQGRYWAGKHGAESFRKAQGYFERAVGIDPAFAAAWVGLGAIHQRQGYFSDELAPRLAQAESAIRRALELEPDSAEAHAALGDLHQARWSWAEAEAEFRRALELAPNSASAHLTYWRLLMRLRRFDEALVQIRAARELDPLSANIAANYGFELGLLERYDEAFALFRESLAIDPDFTLVHAYSWICYQKLGKDPERGQELRAYLVAEDLAAYLPELDRRLAAEGYPDALRWLALELDRMPFEKGSRTGLVAGLLAVAGEEDRAMRWLERGYERRDWEMGWIAVTQDFESLRDRPDFRELVRKVGLPPPG
jgi:TolB-like protein/Tfp pilus assembly protein PilF